MRTALTACIVVTMAACATPETDTAMVKPDPRQGKEVNQICFSQQIRSWRPNDATSVIVEKGLKEDYKLELIGTCRPEDAFSSIGLISRAGGGSCLSPGDRLVTDTRYSPGSCAIRRIYEWHPDATRPSAG